MLTEPLKTSAIGRKLSLVASLHDFRRFGVRNDAYT